MEGFGAVEQERDEPVFHHDWERRVFGLNFSGAAGNVDRFRHAIERMGAVEYLNTSYYEHWLAAIERGAIENGFASVVDLEAARAHVAAGGAVARRDDPELARQLVSAVRTPAAPPAAGGPAHRWDTGDTVRVRRTSPSGHTRCPRYVRGAVGTVEATHPPARLPDASADGVDRVEPLYGVSFAASELWGRGDHRVALDLWESYLEEPDG